MPLAIKWIGHSGFEISVDGRIIYTDPHEGKYVDKADLVLITHSHYDHCDASQVERLLRPETVIIAPPDCASKFKGRIQSLKAGEETAVDRIRIRALDAYNTKRFRSPGVPFHPKGFGVGYLLMVAGKTIYHAGDTDFIPEMKVIGHVDVALLPSGGTYTMDNEEAAEAALAISPSVVIPMHRWDSNPEYFRKIVQARNSKIRVILLKIGEQFEVV